jgi:hypothetical protein
MPLNECPTYTALPQQIKDYILSKKEVHIANGLDEATAEKNAINEFKNETVKSLEDVHKQVGNEIFPQNKTNENAIQEQSAGSVLQRQQGQTGETGGERTGVESGIKGNVPPEQGQTQTETSGEEKKLIGIHHEALGNIADKMGLEQPERGTFLSAEEQTQRGRELLKGGADPLQVATDFKNDGKVNADIISVARAHFENLLKSAEAARIKFGKNSEQFKTTLDEANKWEKEVVKPMGTASGGAMTSLQGQTDLDTGSFVSVSRAVEDKTQKPLTPQQSDNVESLTNKIKEQDKQIEDLQKQFAENIDKEINEQQKPKNRERAKKIIEGNKKVKGEDADLIFQSAKRDYVAARVAKAVDKGDSIDKVVDDIAKEGLIKPENIDKAKDYFKGLAGNEPESTKADLLERFADKRDNKFSPEDVKDIWNYAKENYVDKGRTVSEMIRGVSADLGLSAEQVLRALEQPKGSKAISDEMYRMQNRRNQVQNKVKEFVRTVTTPKWVKWLKAVPNFFFQKAIFGHGSVGMVTHAGYNISDPAIQKIYWRNFANQFKNSFGSLTKEGEAEYQKRMEFLKSDPLFITAKRAGVKVDPSETSDDYLGLKNWMGKVGVLGDRGFNALKQFRMDYFSHEYNRLSEVEKADPETLKTIAQIVNHATGTADFNPHPVVRTIMFAPRLVYSQWARAIGDPVKALVTLTKWNDASLAKKVEAKIIVKKSGRILATYLAGLATNQALLYATGSNQSINFTDPTKKDWLKFKIGDSIVDFSGGIVPTIGLVGHLLYLPFESRQELGTKEHSNRIDAFKNTVVNYALAKASPFAGTAKDAITAHDYMGNTMPWSDDKPKNRYAHKLDWEEYLFTEQTPIPVEEASKDIYNSMKERGMSHAQINDVFTGLFKAAIVGGTGTRLSEDYSLEQKGGSGGGGGTTGALPSLNKSLPHLRKLK